MDFGGRQHILIESLKRGLNIELQKRGFLPAKLPYKDSGVENLFGLSQAYGVWMREFDWRTELIICPPTLEITRKVLINFDVTIYVPKLATELVIDATSVASICGRTGDYKLSRIPLGYIQSKSLRKIVMSTEYALTWFENYDSVNKCLERLQSTERNGVAVGTTPHHEVIRFLHTLSPRASA